MFEKLFKQPSALMRHRAAPFAEERHRFLSGLSDRGFPAAVVQSTAGALLRINDAFSLSSRPGEQISRDEILLMGKNKRGIFVSLAYRWLRFLGRLKQETMPVNPFAKQLDAFAVHLRDERCLSSSTIGARLRFLQRFFRQISNSKGEFSAFDATQIDEALLQMVTSNWGRGRGPVRSGGGSFQENRRASQAAIRWPNRSFMLRAAGGESWSGEPHGTPP